jgi:spore coat-associated protein N
MPRYTTTRDRNTPPGRERRRRGRALAVLAGLLVAFVGTGTVAYALLTAVATGDEPVSSGTLSLTLASGSGSAGFTGAVGPLAPTDVVNRFVDVTNGGSLDAQNLTIAVAAATANKLSTDATNRLKVGVSLCSVAWTVGSNACPGTTTTPITSTALATLGTAAQTLVAGAVPAGTVEHLRVTLTLPDQAETTLNGVPQTSPTIQGLSNTLTWTFQVQQRPGTVTTS